MMCKYLTASERGVRPLVAVSEIPVLCLLGCRPDGWDDAQFPDQRLVGRGTVRALLSVMCASQCGTVRTLPAVSVRGGRAPVRSRSA